MKKKAVAWVEVWPTKTAMVETVLLTTPFDVDESADQVLQSVRILPHQPRAVTLAGQLMRVAAEREKVTIKENEYYANGQVTIPAELGGAILVDPS